MKRLFCILFLALLLSSACEKKAKDCTKEYHVTLPVEVVNKRDTIQVGDTLKFYSSFSQLIPNDVDNEILNIPDFQFDLLMLFRDLSPNSIADHTGSQFDFDILQGTFEQFFISSSNKSSLDFQYDFVDEQYTFEVDIICKKTGNFGIFIVSDYETREYFGEADFVYDRRCEEEEIFIFSEMNGGELEDNNHHLVGLANDTGIIDR